jgi:hypothetical protein
VRVGILLAVTALAAGCSGGGSEEAPALSPAAVRDVPPRVREAGTFAFGAAYTREVEGRAPERYLGHRGAVDVVAGTGALQVDLSAVFAGLPSAERYEQPVELEWTPTELRVLIAAEQQSMPRAQGRASAGLLGRLPDEPEALVELLEEAEDTRQVGVERIRGGTTVRFTCTVRARTAAAAGAPVELTGAFAEERHGPTLPLDVWLDEEGLPRRIEYVVRLEPVVSQGKQILPRRLVRGTYELSDFGEPIGG